MKRNKILTFGEPLAVLMKRLNEENVYESHIGGAELNFAINAAQLGFITDFLSRVGDDGFGRQILEYLGQHGINTNMVSVSGGKPTGHMTNVPVTEGHRKIDFYRKNSAFTTIDRDIVDDIDFSEYSNFHVSGIPLAIKSVSSTVWALMNKACESGTKVSFDPNFRPGLWKGREHAGAKHLKRFAEKCDIVMPGIDEAELMTGSRNMDRIADSFLNRNPNQTIIIKDENGAFAADQNKRTWVKGYHVPKDKIVSLTGAGDAFAAGFITATLEGLPIEEAVARGCAAGAMVIQHMGDNGLGGLEKLRNFQAITPRASIEK
jgi:2-dehydro-3-deoxygluconokinase